MTTLPASPLLSVKGLSVDFDFLGRKIAAVRDISFDLAAGEILGIVGESGSGKSVTCRAILGLLPPGAQLHGQVLLGGTNLCALPAPEMAAVRGRQISMIFQNPSSHLDPLMTIGRQIAEAPLLRLGKKRGEARASAIRMLEEVRIRDPQVRVDSYPHELSGGMKQRAMIASAISCEPKILLADEPTTALDVTVQARILDLLKDINRRRGLSVVLISHDLGVIAEICDRVLVMRQGRIIEAGTTDEIIRQPQEAYTRLLVESQPGRRKPLLPPKNVADRQPVLSIRNLTVEFAPDSGVIDVLRGRSARRIRAVNDVSFEVQAGESFAIVGESGSGKSTIARAIARLNRPKSGSIRFDGEEAAQLSGNALRSYRRAVQMVFQSPYDSLNPRMRIGDAIEEPLIRHGLARRGESDKQVRMLFDMVELPHDLRNRKPHELSGGQCQRVGIARALALSPRVLIADEITSALDVTIQAQILDLLRRLQQSQGLTLIYISHDLAVVRSFCDRVAVLSAGEIVESGPVSGVLTHPAQAYTKALLAAAPMLNR